MHHSHESAKVSASAERYRTLLEINNAIITNLTQDTLLHAICKALEQVMPVYRASITLYDPDKEKLRILAISPDWTTDYFRAGFEMDVNQSHTGWVVKQQRPLIRRDIETEGEYPIEPRLLEEGIRSFCVVPLILEGIGIGTLNIGSDVKGRYTEADAEFLLQVGNQVALAVGNMKSYQQIATLNIKVERNAERYRTLLGINNAIISHLTRETLLDSVSDILRRIMPMFGAVITLYNAETESFRYFALASGPALDYFRVGREFSRHDTIAGWVFDNQRFVIRRDLEKEQQYPNDVHLVATGIRSDCIVPMIVGGKSIGTLGVGSLKTDQYCEADAEILQDVANQVALAITNMNAYEEIAELKARLENENVYLQEEIRTDHNFEEITGNSPALLDVLRKVEQVAPTDSTVLIYGETGTGKELIARAIHDRSARKKRPLLKVNCSAISAGLVESELFGHVKGAFTGALERHIGRFELADGGTIFLDEIGELPLATQVKLLRVLQEREFEPVGSNRPVKVDVRVIAATNRNLQESIRTGEFRSDLFYRLNVFPIDVPPLRERRSDVSQLAMFFLARFSKKLGKNIQSIPREMLDRLENYSWPGNVRELQNIIERAAILSRSSVLELERDLFPGFAEAVAPGGQNTSTETELSSRGAPASAPSTLEELERAHIAAVLNQTAGVVEGPRGAAKILGLHPNTLRHRMQKLGLKRGAHHAS
jgi:formate hydrogenlyase transcriptional activator